MDLYCPYRRNKTELINVLLFTNGYNSEIHEQCMYVLHIIIIHSKTAEKITNRYFNKIINHTSFDISVLINTHNFSCFQQEAIQTRSIPCL